MVRKRIPSPSSETSYRQHLLPQLTIENLLTQEEITEKGSTFQAHLLPVQDINKATAAKNAFTEQSNPFNLCVQDRE